MRKNAKQVYDALVKRGDKEMIEDFEYWRKRDANAQHDRLVNFSQKFQDQWFEEGGVLTEGKKVWVMDSITWYTFRKTVSGKMVCMEELIPCNIERVSPKRARVQVDFAGPKAWFDRHKRKFLKYREDMTVYIPINDIVLVKR